MPVTAKLSRHFYETFGDDIANEFVEWFNQVDTTYRTNLRELNELNFARFDAKLEQRIAELRSYLETRLTEQDQRIAALDQRITGARAELVRWMFVFWIGTLAPLAGLIILLTR